MVAPMADAACDPAFDCRTRVSTMLTPFETALCAGLGATTPHRRLYFRLRCKYAVVGVRSAMITLAQNRTRQRANASFQYHDETRILRIEVQR